MRHSTSAIPAQTLFPAPAEILRELTDDLVWLRGATQQRILFAEDTDFGQPVYTHAHASGGVILIRFPAGARTNLGKQVLQLIEQAGDRLKGAFVVLQPARTRIGPSPS